MKINLNWQAMLITTTDRGTRLHSLTVPPPWEQLDTYTLKLNIAHLRILAKMRAGIEMNEAAHLVGWNEKQTHNFLAMLDSFGLTRSASRTPKTNNSSFKLEQHKHSDTPDTDKVLRLSCSPRRCPQGSRW